MYLACYQFNREHGMLQQIPELIQVFDKMLIEMKLIVRLHSQCYHSQSTKNPNGFNTCFKHVLIQCWNNCYSWSLPCVILSPFGPNWSIRCWFFSHLVSHSRHNRDYPFIISAGLQWTKWQRFIKSRYSLHGSFIVVIPSIWMGYSYTKPSCVFEWNGVCSVGPSEVMSFLRCKG